MLLIQREQISNYCLFNLIGRTGFRCNNAEISIGVSFDFPYVLIVLTHINKHLHTFHDICFVAGVISFFAVFCKHLSRNIDTVSFERFSSTARNMYVSYRYHARIITGILLLGNCNYSSGFLRVIFCRTLLIANHIICIIIWLHHVI